MCFVLILQVAFCYNAIMKIKFDIPKLQYLLSAFCNLTKMTITLFDADLNCITDAGEWKKYCLAIGNEPHLLEKCEGCNRANAELALNQRDTFVYTCHAGICEAVVPIFIEDKPIAYLMIGKFRDMEQFYSSEEMAVAAAHNYELDGDKLLAAYRELPVFTKSSIDNAIIILKSLVYYICDERAIRIERDISAIELDKYIDEHISEKITYDTLCRAFNKNRNKINLMFRDNFGESPLDHIIKRRIELAKKLLVTTQLSAQEIADRVGMNTYDHFYRVFKKHTGCSLAQYRRNHFA